MSKTVEWNPNQYLKFADHRLRPALELLSRIRLENPAVIHDLGCGTGNVTNLLAQRWPEAEIHGMDTSAEMLKKASADHPHINWHQADISSWEQSPAPDLIFTNAALHWVENHEELFPRLAGMLNAGGCLAIQVPANWKKPSHQLLRDVLDDCGGRNLWTDGLRAELDAVGILPVEDYFRLLSPNVKSLDVWRTEYMQVLEQEDAVFNWVRSTVVRPVLAHLDEANATLFVDEFKARLRRAYPMQADGTTLFPFSRLFIVATV